MFINDKKRLGFVSRMTIGSRFGAGGKERENDYSIVNIIEAKKWTVKH